MSYFYPVSGGSLQAEKTIIDAMVPSSGGQLIYPSLRELQKRRDKEMKLIRLHERRSNDGGKICGYF
jgi:hypothetical protein